MTSSAVARLLVEPPRPDWIRRHPKATWLAVGTVCVGAFMGQLDASIVTLAVPSLRTDLHTSLSAVEWVSLTYLLVLVGTLSAVGRWADMAGRKLLYIYGFLVFTVASLGCGLAPTLAVLIGMRVVQAFGAAMLQANSVALIRTTARPDQLNRAIGLQGAAQAIGLAMGPALGGALIGWGGWRWVFYVNVPAGALGIVLGWLLLPRTRARAPRTRFDWKGALALLPASAALLLALSLLGRDGLSAAVVAAAAACAALFGCFVIIERRASAPLVDLSLFADREFRAGVGSGLLAYLVLFGVLFVSPLYLETHDLITPGSAGLLITALPLCLGCAALAGAAAADRFGSTVVTSTGMLLVSVALVVAAAGAGTRAVLVAMLALAGAGLGLFTPANNAAVAGAGHHEQAGMVSGVLNMTRGIGTALGVAITGAAFTLTGGTHSLNGTEHGYQVSLAVLTFFAASAALWCLRRGAPRRTGEPAA